MLYRNLIWIHFPFSIIVFLSNLIVSSGWCIISIGVIEKWVDSSVGSIFKSLIEINIGKPRHFYKVFNHTLFSTWILGSEPRTLFEFLFLNFRKDSNHIVKYNVAKLIIEHLNKFCDMVSTKNVFLTSSPGLTCWKHLILDSFSDSFRLKLKVPYVGVPYGKSNLQVPTVEVACFVVSQMTPCISEALLSFRWIL